MRTITVRGKATVYAKPDQISIGFTVSSQGAEYVVAADDAANKLSLLKSAVQSAGFGSDSLKIRSYNADTVYDNVPEDGIYRRVFSGYRCTYELGLEFALDLKRLADVLSKVSACKSSPDITLAFQVRDPEPVRDMLLKEAAINARKKAQILCSACNVVLGSLESIVYDWQPSALTSPTVLGVQPKMAASGMREDVLGNLGLENIEVSDTVTFIWSLEA